MYWMETGRACLGPSVSKMRKELDGVTGARAECAVVLDKDSSADMVDSLFASAWVLGMVAIAVGAFDRVSGIGMDTLGSKDDELVVAMRVCKGHSGHVSHLVEELLVAPEIVRAGVCSWPR